MINSVPPEEFLDMLPECLKQECIQYRITHQQIINICDVLNKLRNGQTVSSNVSVARLGNLDLRNCRFTNTETGSTFLIKFEKHNLHKTHDNWTIELVKDLNYLTSNEGVTTWHICKAKEKVMPLRYKEFLKCKFQGLNMATVNKMDTFYDRYIKTYNEIYQRELDKHLESA